MADCHDLLGNNFILLRWCNGLVTHVVRCTMIQVGLGTHVVRCTMIQAGLGPVGEEVSPFSSIKDLLCLLNVLYSSSSSLHSLLGVIHPALSRTSSPRGHVVCGVHFNYRCAVSIRHSLHVSIPVHLRLF